MATSITRVFGFHENTVYIGSYTFFSILSEFLSSLMSPQLCNVCSTIPSDFWGQANDQFEYTGMVSHPMQTLGSMKLAVKHGCQLCAILMSPHSYGSQKQLETYKIGIGDKEMLYLRRSPGCPERGVALVAGPGLGTDEVSQSYFSRVPSRWTGVYNYLLYH